MNELIEYVRNKSGNRIGVVVSAMEDRAGVELVCIGWSLCCKRDRWNPDTGLMIARNRRRRGFNTELPHEIRPVYARMLRRAKSYFKNQPVDPDLPCATIANLLENK